VFVYHKTTTFNASSLLVNYLCGTVCCSTDNAKNLITAFKRPNTVMIFEVEGSQIEKYSSKDLDALEGTSWDEARVSFTKETIKQQLKYIVVKGSKKEIISDLEFFGIFISKKVKNLTEIKKINKKWNNSFFKI